LACWRASGATVSGIRPVIAGLKKACPAPSTPASPIIAHTGAVPVSRSTARIPSLTQRARSALTIVIDLGSRSAITPPSIRNATSGTVSAASTWLTSATR
jgi:hypothetical protein